MTHDLHPADTRQNASFICMVAVRHSTVLTYTCAPKLAWGPRTGMSCVFRRRGGGGGGYTEVEQDCQAGVLTLYVPLFFGTITGLCMTHCTIAEALCTKA
jgi:hypothetical protein